MHKEIFTLLLIMPAIIIALGTHMALVPLRLAATPFGLVLAHAVVTMPFPCRSRRCLCCSRSPVWS